MAYNSNMYPVSYLPVNYVSQYNQQPQLSQPYQQYQQSQQTPQMQLPINAGSPIWVQGEAGAKSYLVAPNTTVQLWDSESQTIYLKSADASGMPSIKTLEYNIKNDNQPIQAKLVEDEYISREEFDALKTQIMSIKREMESLKINSMGEGNNG